MQTPGPVFEKRVEHKEEILLNRSTATTHERRDLFMLNHDFTAKLFNLEEVIITNVENEGGILHIHLELPRRDHVCPCCGEKTRC